VSSSLTGRTGVIARFVRVGFGFGIKSNWLVRRVVDETVTESLAPSLLHWDEWNIHVEAQALQQHLVEVTPMKTSIRRKAIFDPAFTCWAERGLAERMKITPTMAKK